MERIVDSNEPAKFESYGARRTRLREYPIWQLLAVLLNGRSLFVSGSRIKSTVAPVDFTARGEVLLVF